MIGNPAQINHPPINFQIHLVKMPGRMRFRTALAQMRGDHRTEVVQPAAHGLVRHRDPALREQILDVTKAECEPEVEPNRLMYDLGRKPISGVADFPHTLGYSAYAHPTRRVGDDLYVTNPKLIEKGIAQNATNAVLIKLNQIGTVTETIAAISACRAAGWNYIISHRSGETANSFIADFSVAMDGGQIKAGAPCRSERLAKYNRLLQIEREVAGHSYYSSPFKHLTHARKDVAVQQNTGVITTSGISGREIVAVIEEATTAQRCLTVALLAAQRVNSLSLSALHICVDPAKLVTAPEELSLQKMREINEGSAKEKLVQARGIFRKMDEVFRSSSAMA